MERQRVSLMKREDCYWIKQGLVEAKVKTELIRVGSMDNLLT